ncbi:pilus assembly protein CpaB [Nocardioides sp. zg-579]|uniref:Pilus assembly protein CpaB n=1 Tax=Nocardioides marmotae TaxID=2663857 RepID=A0A6I3J7C6_9ACTN|nr:SAF domain-containing protein [Nocardioides marmotae]MCR6030227.1 pilus assembly protein CpaB [Gordonia jinghuaiqii]MTB93859.1 pilus assembly protein CpaB [Nocardioides marmotae]QKE00184.1 pilus assembly protein CpaB [Nocardioides marmotae]
MRLPDRLTRPARAVRRAVLARRRPLAAVLAAAAVAFGLQATAAPPPRTVPVTVAARDLPAGTVVGPGDLTTAAWAPGTAPAERPDPVGRVLAAAVRRGEPVTDVRLVGPRLTEGRPGLTAVPVRLPDAGMAALLEVGDEIDLLAADPRAGGAAVVAAGVPVLALPLDEEPGVGGNGLTGRLVVVGAAPTEVSALADAATRAFLTYAWSG